MTIDEAIRFADKAREDTTCKFENALDYIDFFAMCASALRLTKQMSDYFGLEERHD